MPAHLQLAPRVAFPDPVRGWPVTSGLARCQKCDAMITSTLRNLISDILNGLCRQVQMLSSGTPRPWRIYPSITT